MSENSYVKIFVKSYDSKPRNVTAPPSIVYKYVHIAPNIQKHAKIIFRIPKTFLLYHSANAEQIRLLNFDRTWKILPTKRISESADFIKYEADMFEFSWFAAAIV